MGASRILLPETPEARALADELKDFEISVSANATATFNAKTGSHDDLVCALGLAVLLEQERYGAGSVPYI